MLEGSSIGCKDAKIEGAYSFKAPAAILAMIFAQVSGNLILKEKLTTLLANAFWRDMPLADLLKEYEKKSINVKHLFFLDNDADFYSPLKFWEYSFAKGLVKTKFDKNGKSIDKKASPEHEQEHLLLKIYRKYMVEMFDGSIIIALNHHGEDVVTQTVVIKLHKRGPDANENVTDPRK